MEKFFEQQFKMLNKGIVATPQSREDLESFAKANQGSMDMVLMQMAINFGYKIALENVQEELINQNQYQVMKVKRNELKIGQFYYMDDRKDTIGLLVEIDEQSDTLLFDCGASSTYVKSPASGKQHLTPFSLSFGGDFESVVNYK